MALEDLTLDDLGGGPTVYQRHGDAFGPIEVDTREAADHLGRDRLEALLEAAIARGSAITTADLAAEADRQGVTLPPPPDPDALI